MSLVGFVLCSAAALYLFYPRIAAWAIRAKVMAKLERRLDRKVSAGSIDVDRDGHAVLENLTVSGPTDGDAPLVRIERVVVDYDFWASWTGEARVYQVMVEGAHGAALRTEDGADNFSDILRRFSERDGNRSESSGRGMRPDKLIVKGSSFELRDDKSGVSLVAGDIALFAGREGPATMTVSGIAMSTSLGPEASLGQVVATADLASIKDTAAFELSGGRVSLWPGMSLTGIRGTLAEGDEPGHFAVNLEGGYGGVEGTLWNAEGWLDPWTQLGSIAMKADRFTFDRIAPVLEDSIVVDYEDTSVDAEFAVNLEKWGAEFNGRFDLTGLNVFHPFIAEKPVRDISVSGPISGTFERSSRKIIVSEADLHSRGVEYKIQAFAFLPGGTDPETGERRTRRRVGGKLTIPRISCQAMLNGIPEELTPYIHDTKLRGKFDAEIEVDIDWEDLDKTRLVARGGLKDLSRGKPVCTVRKIPEAIDAKRFKESFVHYVEVEKDEWTAITIGPENPDFVPIWDVSPYLLNSLMTTEDSRFYKHHGFIATEFRTALIKDLKAGYFKFGASSITMQMVRNVMLYREKTLARKLQELFLTWYIETELEKDRIFEIYVNAIEYGPGIYGIGPAARHFFNKHPRDLNAKEAAFFSSILPGPKSRYRQYCENRLWRWTQAKIERILRLMVKRERMTEAELDEALATPFEFVRPEDLDERKCLKMVKEAIEAARPTNPLDKDEDDEDEDE